MKRRDSISENIYRYAKFKLWLERAMDIHGMPLHESRTNADVEKVIQKLRSAYRQNQQMTFREFLSIFAAILGWSSIHIWLM